MTDARIIPFPQPDALDPAAALFNDLIRKARPGISHREALANGAHHRARIGKTAGMTPADYRAWIRQHHGRTLIVHLDEHGNPGGAHLLSHDEAEQYLAKNPNAVAVATWGVTP